LGEKGEKVRRQRRRARSAISSSKVRVGLAFSNNGLYDSEIEFNMLQVVNLGFWELGLIS